MYHRCFISLIRIKELSLKSAFKPFKLIVPQSLCFWVSLLKSFEFIRKVNLGLITAYRTELQSVLLVLIELS